MLLQGFGGLFRRPADLASMSFALHTAIGESVSAQPVWPIIIRMNRRPTVDLKQILFAELVRYLV
jgi:hypothetical protein